MFKFSFPVSHSAISQLREKHISLLQSPGDITKCWQGKLSIIQLNNLLPNEAVTLVTPWTQCSILGDKLFLP